MSVNGRGTLLRREFLGLSAAAAAALIETACGGGTAATPTTAAPQAASTSANSPGSTTSAASVTGATRSAASPAAASASGPASSGTSASVPAKTGGIINYAEAGDFNDFNPWAGSATNVGIYNQVFSRLLWKDAQGKENPDIAESWQLSPDGLSFTVKMRQGVKWHDGKPCTADDFVTMFGYMKDPDLLKHVGVQKQQRLFNPIQDVQASGPQTLQFRFKNPVPYITDILDGWFAIRIEDKSDVQMLKKLPIGTGPFKMDQWVANQYVKTSKNASFYRTGQPSIDSFVFKRLDKAETLIPNLQSGTLDGIQITSLSDVDPLKADQRYIVEVNESSGSIFNIIVNVTKPPFDKKEVRQALSYSLNRVGMAKSAFFGISRPLTSPFFSPSSLGYREDLVMAHPFDLAKASALLKGAGVSKLEMTANVTPRWPQMKLFCLIWQQDLAKIGIKLTINEVEIAKFYDIGAAKDLLGADVHPWLSALTTRDPAVFWSTQGSKYRGNEVNIFGYRNPELERLVAMGEIELDTEKRRQIYQQLNQIVIDESYMISVANDPRIWAFTKATNGVHYDLNGNLSLDTAWMNR